MINHEDTVLQADLRKRSSIKDELIFSDYDVQTCMVMLVVITALLLSVISVAAATPRII